MSDTSELADTSELRKRTEALTPQQRAEVKHDVDKANGYAWGFQDGAEERMNSAEAWNYMAAYWSCSLEWHEGKRTSMLSIPNAFKAWRETGKIP